MSRRRRQYVRLEDVERMDAELRARIGAIYAGVAERASKRAREATTPEGIEAIWADEVQRALPEIDALEAFIDESLPAVELPRPPGKSKAK